jgi:hypothetical protein
MLQYRIVAVRAHPVPDSAIMIYLPTHNVYFSSSMQCLVHASVVSIVQTQGFVFNHQYLMYENLMTTFIGAPEIASHVYSFLVLQCSTFV